MATAQLKMTSVYISRGYGPRILNGRANFHEGTDTATGTAYAHSAFGTGVVVESPQAKKHGTYGWYIRIRHALGIETSHHSLSAPARFKVGQTVNMGDIVGYAGVSAAGTTGKHVHNGFWLGGKHTDMMKFLKPGQIVSVNYGGNTAAPPAASKPFDNSAATSAARRRRVQFMYDLYWTGPTPANSAVSGRIITDYGSFHVPNMQIFGLLERRRNAAWNNTRDTMLDAEHDIINGFLRTCFHAAMTGITLDPNKFNLALTDGLQKLGKQIVVDLTTGAKGDEIDAAELAATFELAIPRIVNSMIKQQGEALSASAAKK